MSTARHSIKAYRAQRDRFDDPKNVKTGRAGAAFPVAKGEPRDRRPEKGPAPLRIGDEYTGIGYNGHRMVYTVADFYSDGSPRAANGSAYHSDTCPCLNTCDVCGSKLERHCNTCPRIICPQCEAED